MSVKPFRTHWIKSSNMRVNYSQTIILLSFFNRLTEARVDVESLTMADSLQDIVLAL